MAERVRQGGHDVPTDVIRRRFAAGMRHFLQSYRHRAHDWMLFDNSGPAPRLLHEGHMSESMESKLANPDMQGAPRALLRAARRAREIARETGTLLIVVEDGILKELAPGDPGFDSPQRISTTIHDGD